MKNMTLLGRRLLPVLLLLCLLLTGTALADGENLLYNPDFEELDSDGLPVGWYTEAYRNVEGYTLYDSSEDAHDSAACVSVENLAENDARFAQIVEVEPETLYCLSGWIRTEDIPDAGHGANLSVEGVYSFSEELFGTNDWTYVELYGETGEDQYEVTVFARLGGYSGESQGKAWFDSLCLKQVDAVPEDVVADLWFQPDYEVAEADDDLFEDETEEASAAWPWLLAVGILYALVCAYLAYLLRDDPRSALEPDSRKGRPVLIVGLLLSLILQLVLSVRVEGYQVDVNCFLSWGNTMAQTGPVGFYSATSFCDYPPAYVWVLGLNSRIGSILSGLTSTTAGARAVQVAAHKLIPVLCNLLAALGVYRLAREEKVDGSRASLMALALAFNPALILNSAAWCQMDSVLCFALMLVAVFARKRNWKAVMPVYMLAVLIKPQALMLGPLGLLAIIVDWVRHPEDRKSMLIGVGLALGTAALILIPFSIGQEWNWIFTLYGSTLSSYPYATVNTANFYYLFGGNWSAIANPAQTLAPYCLALLSGLWGLWTIKHRTKGRWPYLECAVSFAFALAFAVMGIVGVTWTVLGTTAMVLAFAWVLPMYLRSGDLGDLPLLGGLLFLLLYVLGIKMHERYLFPALFFLALAFAHRRDGRILVLLGLVSATVFVNEGIVLDNSIRLGSSLGHLNSDTRGLAMGISLVNVLCVPLGLWTAHSVCVEKKEPGEPRRISRLEELLKGHAWRKQEHRTDPSLHWKKLDWILMLSVTLVYSVVALCNLGSTKAPQNPWKSTSADEYVVLDLGEHYDDFHMLYFAQVSYSDFTVSTSEDGENWSEEQWAEMAQGQCFRWKYVTLSTASDDGTRSYYNSPLDLSGRYVKISARQVGLILDEVIFRDASEDDLNGRQISATLVGQYNRNDDSPLATEASALLDEQDTLEGQPSWYNSTYFDEIYHARTAFEFVNGTTPYETTHPPLGKLLMALCVMIFGMTPFGWRFAGAMMGILMLPAMYLLGKQLTKRTLPAFAAMMMMALDCMHFTQTRIATIDSFPVLFIILSFFFMLRFMQRDIVEEPIRRVLPDLALSGLFIAFAIASKWIGLYAGVGLAVLYFWTCLRHLRLHALRGSAEKKAQADWHQTLSRILILCAWCCLFFVAVPVLVYLLCYIPYFQYRSFTGLGDYLKAVINAQVGMYNYHSTPGLGMDHPFYSPWYEWPLIRRPMYYAANSYRVGDESYAIFCFGNPAVWLTGLLGIAATAVMWARRHIYSREDTRGLLHWQSTDGNVSCAFVLIGLMAQFLPWVLVPRGTYIYHYFASVPFLCLGTMLLLDRIGQRNRKAEKIVTIIFLCVCLVCFVAFYPYASGVTTPVAWLDFMKQFLHIYYS